MLLNIQIYSLVFSFLYGIFIYLFLLFFYKFVFNNNIFVKVLFSMLFSLTISLIYFILLIKINNGILHVYFFLIILVGYTFTKILFNKIFVKRKWLCYNDYRIEGDNLAKKVVKKKKKFGKRAKSRLFLAFMIFGTIISMLSYKFFYNVKQIKDLKDEKKFYEQQLSKLSDEEKVLKSDIQKLADPTYIARYAREKYLYSKDGELIIRIPDKK